MKVLQGKVVSGQKLAGEWQLPTANLEIFAGNLNEEGVYIAECRIVGLTELLPAVMHYGHRKTTDGKFVAEIHLIDFSRNFYGKSLEVNVLKKIRDTQKFKSIKELFFQIENDVIKARKFFLRRQIKSTWHKLEQKSREILAQKALQEISQDKDFLLAENIYIYAPKDDEISFVKDLCAKFSRKTYFFPKIVKQQMLFFRENFTNLKPGKWGILEPPDVSSVSEIFKPDFVFIPAVGADFAGNRLGNGGGFYDRFLEKLYSSKTLDQPPCQKKNFKTCCVLPDFAVFREIPTEKHDIPIDKIITIFN